MSRYRGYSEDIEVLIEILNELREIKGLLRKEEPKKEIKTNEQPRRGRPKRTP